MRARFGHQHWWPGETPFEVCVGAILTQNTAWTNVERAIANLKTARVLEPEKLFALPEAKLAELIRPAGYFNVKARRLRSFLRVLVEEFSGDLKKLFAGKLQSFTSGCWPIHGVGPETADSMLLYAGGHRSFVIDAYTKRIFERHGWSPQSKVQSPKSAGQLRRIEKALRIGVESKIRRGAAGLLAGLSRATGDGREAFLPDARAALRRMPAQAAAAAQRKLTDDE